MGFEHLQGHSINDQLHGEVPSISWHTIGIKRRLCSIGNTILVNQVPQHLIKNRSPDCANRMHLAQLVDRRIRVRVGRQASRVQICTNACLIVIHPRTQRVIRVACVGCLDADRRRHKVTPTFTHTAVLGAAQAARVGTAAGQTVGETVGVLVEDHTGFKGCVALGGGFGPHVHAHAAGFSVGWGGKVGVVGAGAVLGAEDGKVVAHAAEAGVVDLEIVGSLGETERVQKIVVHVDGVKQLGRGGVEVRGWVHDAGVVGIFEFVSRRCGLVVVQVALVIENTNLSIGIGLGDGIVSLSAIVGLGAIIQPGER